NFLSFLDEKWFNQQNKLLLFGWGVVIIGLSLKSQETLKNILMTILSLFLLYYAVSNESWWMVMFALYIGVAGWFAHRGDRKSVWATRSEERRVGKECRSGRGR